MLAATRTRAIDRSSTMARTKTPATSKIVLGGDKQAAADAQTIRDLILWARKERINISHVTVGAISLVMVDNAALRELAQPRETTPDKPGGIYSQFGGAILGTEQAPTPSGGIEPTIEDDDE